MNTVQSAPVAPLFPNADAARQAAAQVKAGVKAPFVSTQVSTLGGDHRASVMLTVSLDPRSEWKFGILQNSRYGNFSLDYDGTLEYFSGSLPKFRKRKVKSVEDAIKVLNQHLQQAQAPA